jgi:hypothetical protein
MMKGRAAIVLLSGVLFACVQTPPPAPPPPPPPAPPPAPAAASPPAPADRWVAIRMAPCSRFLELSQEDRTAASMFYVGYQASRFGAGDINVSGLGSIVYLATSYCQAFPDRPTAEAFAAAYRMTGP